MKEFMYVFQISKLITFEVNFYTLGTNSAPYFSTSAIEELKTRYNYIEDIRDTFRGSRSSIPFYDIVKLSKMEPKKKGGA